ncbi:sugar transferase [Geomicrobium sp. JCM 19038]|uniref:sugar transferase n=1 Tax=Geomicrobium sp. JCM 19038 TaxID=1460635 RepID=UPI00045F3D64|nr:sugar transferase [Geomicrobium sp. JCM 19038]GAK08394.1 undecaprenyl-phosphate galactosephosphotransferase [Geomicrobium sp. JCM 19038]
MSIYSPKSLKMSKDLSYRIAKRTMDVGLSLLIGFLLIPLFLLLICLVLIIDGKPVFFRQKRVGQHNRTFTMIKFRTMSNDNRTIRTAYNWEKQVPDDFVFKSGSGVYVTKIGKWLRKLSVDELPQLYNVLRGDMSLIGPRPEVPAIAKYYDKNQQKRLKVKPGITGYAQVHGRSDLTHGQKIAYDVHYIENCSLKLDLIILIKTIGTVMTRRGAY